MAVWAIADLHLSFNTPDKSMDLFGPKWIDHTSRVAHFWKEAIQPSDLVLIAGDISWAMSPEQAKADLVWIHELPGTKVLLRGNHDYWWNSLSKVAKVLPPSLHLIQNNSFIWNNIAIGGARLWDSNEFNFDEFIDYQPTDKQKKSKAQSPEEIEKVYLRELFRLETSLKELNNKATADQVRIAMTHYPPIGPELAPSLASHLLEKYKIDFCVFGHLHNVKPHTLPFGTKNGVHYLLTACDALECKPLKILD